MMSFCSRHKTALLIALVLGYLYFRGIGDHGLLDPLEGVNAAVGANAAFQGVLRVPAVGEMPCLGRSMGFWWLEALSLGVFDWEEYSVRFWSEA